MTSHFTPSYKERQAWLSNTKSYEALENYGLGQRCFIVATGPSLKKLPLEKLADDFIFGVNRSYLALQHGLPHIDALVIADPEGHAYHHEEIHAANVSCHLLRANVYNQLDTEKELPSRSLSFPFVMKPLMNEGFFARTLSPGAYRGATVITDVLQIAYFMGFSEVYILGCDLDYSGEKTHFYQNSSHEDSTRNQMPINIVRGSMKVAKQVYDEDNRILLNATEGGSLEEIGRIEFSKLF